MKHFIKLERKAGVSQRQLAAQAKLSFRTIQLLESGRHDAKLSTLSAVTKALGYSPGIIQHRIESIFSEPIDSIAIMSERLAIEGEKNWKHLLFEFVDAFRHHKDMQYVATAPTQGASPKIAALVASTVEALCVELHIKTPPWCAAIPALPVPWFVSGVENLKASALLESPVWFRRRNIFVFENFLNRS